MNLVNLFGHLPVALIAGLIASQAIPYLSALATRAPSWATGFLTLLLATADGFFSTWAAQGDGFNWKAGIGTSLIAFVAAAVHHSKLLSGTPLEASLHAVGTGKPAHRSRAAH